MEPYGCRRGTARAPARAPRRRRAAASSALRQRSRRPAAALRAPRCRRARPCSLPIGWPLLDRRPHRAGIDDARDDVLARAARHHQPDVAPGRPAARCRRCRHRPWPPRSAGPRRTAGAPGNCGSPIRAACAPRRRAPSRLLQAVDHHDQAQIRSARPSRQAVAGLLGEAGLQPVGADVHGEQRIAVVLADLVPGELALAVDLVEVRIGLDDVPREPGELARGHQLLAGRAGRSNCRRSTWSGRARGARLVISSAKLPARCRRCPPPARCRRRCRTG